MKLSKFLTVCAHDTKNGRKKSGWYQKDAAQTTGYWLGSTALLFPRRPAAVTCDLLLLFIR